MLRRGVLHMRAVRRAGSVRGLSAVEGLEGEQELYPSYRILGVFDRRSEEWSSKNELSHPQSSHVLKDYAFWQFNHGDYTFSSAGEYHLDLAAVRPSVLCDATAVLDDDDDGDDDNNDEREGDDRPTHDVVVFPERVWLRGLVESDMPIVMRFALRPEARLDVLLRQLGPRAELASMDSITVLVQAHSSAGPSADEVGEWFSHAARSLGLAHRLDVWQASYAGPGSRLAAARVVVLPPGRIGDVGEDRLEYVVSQEAAEVILSKYVDVDDE